MPDTALLRALFEYDPESGRLSWRGQRGSNQTAGKEAGWIGKNGYRYVTVRDRKFLVHRIVWKMHYDEDPPEFVDHENRDRSHNAINNLRTATKVQNCQNATSSGANKTGVVGIEHRNGRFRARITSNGKTHHIGDFDTLETAAAARRSAELALFGRYAPDQAEKDAVAVSNSDFRTQIGTGRRLYRQNTSGVRGVSWMPKHQKWQVYGNFRGKRTNLGYFSGLEDAKAARAKFDLECRRFTECQEFPS